MTCSICARSELGKGFIVSGGSVSIEAIAAQRSRPTHQEAPPEDELAQHRRARERLEHELMGIRREMVTLARDAQRAEEVLERADDAVSDAQRQLAEVTERRDSVAQRAKTAGRAQRLTEQLNELAAD